jgi:hypothetical protein
MAGDGRTIRSAAAWPRGRRRSRCYDHESRLAESFVEAGKDVAVVPFRADFVFAAHVPNVSLEQIIDASNYHGCSSISARIKASVRLESIRAGPPTFSICMSLVLVRANVSATFSLTVAAQARFFPRVRNDAVSVTMSTLAT